MVIIFKVDPHTSTIPSAWRDPGPPTLPSHTSYKRSCGMYHTRGVIDASTAVGGRPTSGGSHCSIGALLGSASLMRRPHVASFGSVAALLSRYRADCATAICMALSVAEKNSPAASDSPPHTWPGQTARGVTSAVICARSNYTRPLSRTCALSAAIAGATAVRLLLAIPTPHTMVVVSQLLRSDEWRAAVLHVVGSYLGTFASLLTEERTTEHKGMPHRQWHAPWPPLQPWSAGSPSTGVRRADREWGRKAPFRGSEWGVQKCR